MVPGSWIVLASATAGIGTLSLIAQLWQYRDKPGAEWFLGSLGCQALWSLTYAVALLTFDPTLRLALEVLIWASVAELGVFFLAFALAYTGRENLVRTPWTRTLLTLPVVTLLLGATNPLHGLVWSGFQIDSVVGLATVSYSLTTWTFVAAVAAVAVPAAGSFLLFDTVLSYGRLYRREAIAVGVSTIPPLVAFLVWLFGLGSVPQLNLTTVFFLPHIVLDGYAFLRSDMFEFHPATRRAGERAAIDDLGNPVVIVDEQGRVVTLNAPAAAVLSVDKQTALTNTLDDYLDGYLDGDSIDPTASDQRITITRGGTPKTYLVSATPLNAGNDTHVGYTILLQDVTEDLRREQRLEVLNRVLRHNLRNDMTVVRGFASTANEQTSDEGVSELLDTVERKADELVALSEKARRVERVVARDPEWTAISLDDVLADLVEEMSESFPDATIRLDCPALTVETDEETFRVVCEAILENGLEHGSSTGPDGSPIRVTADYSVESVTIRVADDGPGIPEQELAVLDAGRETDLEHSTGLGLWLASWGTRRLGGDLSFDVSDDGTTVNITLPLAERPSESPVAKS